MAEVSLKAIKREGSGKGVARRARAAGRVPAVVYGKGMDPVAIEVDRREFVTALLTDAGLNVLLNIEIDGTKTTAITRELQRDPVRGTLLHADFVKIDLTQEIEVEVPVHLVGESPGAKEGGVLEHPLFTIHVRCLPTNVPESIDADISGLQIGDQLRVAELVTPPDVEILNDPDTVVASVAAPITEEQLEAMVAEAGPAEEAAEEAAAVPEGEEAPAEGEAAPPAAGGPEASPEGDAT
ncbi:MAG TPA: 50S ribosomal protein L25/general stress protein Ctc [Actinomycetota bacterium]|nr:50S ribosomal protein L25/general stress protein Ctc [Actinomycetota bacterium]